MLHQAAVEPGTLELLKEICTIPQIAEFALGGGTNIALRKGHRISIDLDFFTCEPFRAEDIYKVVTTCFKKSELLFEQNQTMMFIINEIKVDFVLYPFHWTNPFEIIDGTKLISPEDIIPMKLQALSNRFAKKDFWDIETLLESFSLEEMISIFKMKFHQIDAGFIVHSLTNFEQADTEQDPIPLNHKTWDSIKKSLMKTVRIYTQQFL